MNAGNDGYLREIQRQIDEKDKVIEALINSLLLAESMIVQLEAGEVPGDYPMYGLATIQETIRLHAAYQNMVPTD